jgi:hypothetical protein
MERIAHHLKEAQTIREVAALLSLRPAHTAVLRAAFQYEQLAAYLRCFYDHKLIVENEVIIRRTAETLNQHQGHHHHR